MFEDLYAAQKIKAKTILAVTKETTDHFPIFFQSVYSEAEVDTFKIDTSLSFPRSVNLSNLTYQWYDFDQLYENKGPRIDEIHRSSKSIWVT